MRVFLFFFVAAFILLPVQIEAQESSLRNQVETILKQQQLIGLVWSGHSAEGAFIGAAGLANVEQKTAMAIDTKVQVGSVTKTVLALGILRLISEDRLSLDTEVESLLPMLNWQNPWAQEAPIKIRHLLEHTAGLDNIRMWQFLNSSVGPSDSLFDAFPYTHKKLLTIRTKPGSQYSYSNMGYALLGLIIEETTNLAYENFLEAALLAPLGMSDSTFYFLHQSTDPKLAMGYFEDAVAQSSVPTFLRPAGQFTTTAVDMLKFSEFLMGDGVLSNKVFILPELMEQFWTTTSTKAAKGGLIIGHGLGLAARDRHGVLSYCHPGETYGFRAYLCVFPEERKAFFYGVNTDNEAANYELINQLFIKQLSINKISKTPANKNDAKLCRYVGFYNLDPNNMAQFSWIDWMFNSIWISEKGGKLLIQSLQNADQELQNVGEHLFRAKDRRLASHVFLDEHKMYLSTGLTTYVRNTSYLFFANWISMILGLVGIVYLILRGSWVVLNRDNTMPMVQFLPYLNVMAFVLPAYLFAQQSFLEFGEKTIAATSLAILSGLLPITLIIALIHKCRSKKGNTLDLIGYIATLQFLLALVYWEVLPLIFW
ncbi:MAG: CubicO group peptidase (beta-lactamase class C family) [Candidatus Azotimanducaceae bacterium]